MHVEIWSGCTGHSGCAQSLSTIVDMKKILVDGDWVVGDFAVWPMIKA